MNPEYYMRMAIKEAEKAAAANEVPVGAILVIQDTIIAKGYNQVERLQDATAHAEMIAITSAFQHLGCKYLPEASIYITLEPCLMCSGALYWSKVARVVYGASDEKNGYHTCCQHSPFHPKTSIESGLLADECAQLMKDFFKQKRN